MTYPPISCEIPGSLCLECDARVPFPCALICCCEQSYPAAVCMNFEQMERYGVDDAWLHACPYCEILVNKYDGRYDPGAIGICAYCTGECAKPIAREGVMLHIDGTTITGCGLFARAEG